MDPRYNHNWPPQAYTNSQYVPYAPSPQQQQQQPHGYQHPGYAQPYPPIQSQVHQGYAQPQPQQHYPHMPVPRPSSQHYPPATQGYAQQQQQPQPQQPRAQPQVIIPVRHPSYVSPMQQMQPPKIRHVQVPIQRTGGSGIAQTDGSQDGRRYSNQQVPTPPHSKHVQQSQSHQENGPRPQQRPSNAPSQNQHQHRAPLQQQFTPQQRVPSASQTPSSQYRSPSIHQTTPKPKAHPQVVIPARSSSHQLTPTRPAHAPSKALPADLSVMLLSAADEYVAAARGMVSLLMRHQREADVRQYHKLMAAGLGCMDTVLREFNMLPRDEAKLRLRYAGLLIEETDNTTEIDEVFSKQISLCNRCRLQSLKYASLHLQARYQFKTNRSAALKSLDKHISEAEQFDNVAWEYAFRFLRVSLTLQLLGRVEAVKALGHLQHIRQKAEKQGDKAVYVVANTLEAMVHLRSGAADRLEQAQRAIALARSLQLQLSAERLGSFGTLLDLLDVACGVHNGAPDVAKSSALIGSVINEKTFSLLSDTGNVTVVIERSSSGSLTTDTGGIFRKNSAGLDELVFSWLPKADLRTLCVYLCALDQNVHERGFQYITEAHQRAKDAAQRPISRNIPISVAVAQRDWNSVLDWHSLFALGLMGCYRGDKAQATANEALVILKKRAAHPPPNSKEIYHLTLSYLSAVFDQRNGLFDSAMHIYSSDALQMPAQGSSAKVDFAILAALNTMLIMRNLGPSYQSTTKTLLSQLTPLCENHPNQYIRMAHRLVYAMSSPDISTDASILRKRTSVQVAVNKANDIMRRTQNREFVMIALPFFAETFFKDRISSQAIQAVRAVRSNNKSSQTPLWTAVAADMSRHTLERNGLIEEAQVSRREYEEIEHLLPPALTDGSDIDAEGEEDDDDVEITG